MKEKKIYCTSCIHYGSRDRGYYGNEEHEPFCSFHEALLSTFSEACADYKDQFTKEDEDTE